jgi:nitroimidazol reductase NimA-like FMN-containing flavoprotein (pyridoxamine 5'-phosphate oxidase superfamily)
VPITFAYADGYLYGYSTPGQKIEWMRTNPLVCVQADEINFMHDWMSIVVYAVYEELTHEDNDVECRRAEALLDRHALWWEPAHISALFRGEDAEVKPIFFRLRIVEVTGRRVRPSELSV